MVPGWLECRTRGLWGRVALSLLLCLLIYVRCTVVCLVWCAYLCIVIGVDLYVMAAVVLYRSGAISSCFQRSSARYNLLMRSLARACLC
jgi:hypothetical protein